MHVKPNNMILLLIHVIEVRSDVRHILMFDIDIKPTNIIKFYLSS